MDKFKKGKLHSSSKKGKKVTDRKQAMAIMMSEKREGEKGKEEYKSNKKSSVEPTERFKKRFGVK